MQAPRKFLFVSLTLLPVLLTIAVFHRGLRAWFQQDDFAHLQLAARTTAAELPSMLLQPVAQGTFRPVSERGFYWVFYRLFGLDALPYRVFCFLLHAGNCILLTALLRRVSGSVPAALCGAAAWAVNPCLALPLAWVATTNQVLWATCVLATVYLFVLFCETGRKGFLSGSWAVFLLGLGVLESQIAVPAILVGFAFLFHKERVRSACAFFLPAVLFAGLHLWLIPRKTHGAYAMEFGPSLFTSVGKYWVLSWEVPAAAAFVAVLLVPLLWWPQSRRLTVWGVVWWLALLGPVLPLRLHVTDYYLTVPLLGLSVLVAGACAAAPRLTAVAVLAWVCAVAPVAGRRTIDQVEKSRNIEAVVLGAGEVSRQQPGKTILLAGVNDALFWSGIYDHPFSLIGRTDVYLTPESAAGLTPYPDLFRASDYTLPDAVVAELLKERKAAVYTVQGRKLLPSTAVYEKLHQAGGGVSRIVLGDPNFEPFLGEGWHSGETGFRWTTKTATVRLTGTGQAITVSGFCAPQQFERRGRIVVRAKWNGSDLGERILRRGEREFSLRFDLPSARETNGVLTLAVDATTRAPGDSRELGLAITRIELQ